MKKNNKFAVGDYIAPQLEVVELSTEQCFATSIPATHEGFEDDWNYVPENNL